MSVSLVTAFSTPNPEDKNKIPDDLQLIGGDTEDYRILNLINDAITTRTIAILVQSYLTPESKFFIAYRDKVLEFNITSGIRIIPCSTTTVLTLEKCKKKLSLSCVPDIIEKIPGAPETFTDIKTQMTSVFGNPDDQVNFSEWIIVTEIYSKKHTVLIEKKDLTTRIFTQISTTREYWAGIDPSERLLQRSS